MIDDILNEFILIGKNAYRDEFGIERDEAFTIKEVAELYRGKIGMLPKRRRKQSDKAKALGLEPKKTKRLHTKV